MACSKCQPFNRTSSLKYKELKVLPVGKCFHATFIHENSTRSKDWVHTAIQELSKEGYKCFDIAHNGTPKLSKLQQKIQAFKRSKTVIVLLTAKCLKNRTFQRDLDLLTSDEIFNGGNLHERILPLWLDIVPLPDSLSYVQPLDASSSRDTWWKTLIRAIDFDRLDNKVDNTDDDMEIQSIYEDLEHMKDKLKSLGSRKTSQMLHKPVVLELYHFLAQCADESVLISVLESNGVSISDKGIYPVNIRCALEVYESHMGMADLTLRYKHEGPPGAWMYLDTSQGFWKKIEINLCMLWDIPCTNFTETFFINIPQVRDMVFVVQADFKQQFPIEQNTSLPVCGQCRYSSGQDHSEPQCLTLILEQNTKKHCYAYFVVPFCGPEDEMLSEAKEMLRL